MALLLLVAISDKKLHLIIKPTCSQIVDEGLFISLFDRPIMLGFSFKFKFKSEVNI